MRLERLCEIDLKYIGGFHMARPYGNESGVGWGIGDGVVSGDRLSGTLHWSNQPRRRGDGTMLPNARGVIATEDGAEVFVDLTGRTVWVEQGDERVGRQLLMTLFESADERYTWLNNMVCMAEGKVDPETLVVHLEIHVCHSEIA
jgi:Protein of unknown function (DUF3237)